MSECFHDSLHAPYPSGPLAPMLFGTGMAAALIGATILRRKRVRSFWPYIAGPGVLSWFSLYLGGFHPALALVPVIPFMPHQHRDLGVYDVREHDLPDTLNRFEHWWSVPVQFVLLLFGFANAGVPFTQVGPGTVYVLAALLVGKPLGIASFTALASLTGAQVPPGVRNVDILLIGVTAAIGFTVALFFATAAFPEGAALNETRMGALLSFLAAPLAFVCSNRPATIPMTDLGRHRPTSRRCMAHGCHPVTPPRTGYPAAEHTRTLLHGLYGVSEGDHSYSSSCSSRKHSK